MSDIFLNINGNKFGGWTGATIRKSLYNMTGSFGLTATDIYPGNAQKWGIAMGDECTIEIDDQTVITGYLDEINISYDASGHNIQIGGRDKTADLIDCSFTQTAKEWNKQTISKIITDLCSPFGITIDIDDSVSEAAAEKTPNDKFKVNEGETVFDAIMRLCKTKGILPVSYCDGKLILTRAGTERTNDSLELGVNIKAGSLSQSNKDRFQTYIVRGQGIGNDDKDLVSTNQPVAQYSDPVILRYRPLVVWPDCHCDTKYCQDRAMWEAVNRAGQSRRIDYEVQGWTQSNGVIWPLNSLVSVKDTFLEVETTMLISDINFIVDESTGMITRLELVHPNTFDMPPATSNTDKVEEIKTGFDWIAALTIQD